MVPKQGLAIGGKTGAFMRTIEAIYGVPDEEPVVQLFVPNGGQWGEVRNRDGQLEVELFAPSGQSSWVIAVDELIHALSLAKQRLAGQ